MRTQFLQLIPNENQSNAAAAAVTAATTTFRCSQAHWHRLVLFLDILLLSQHRVATETHAHVHANENTAKLN